MSGDGADTAVNARNAYTEVCRAYERIDDFRAKLLGFLPVVSGIGLFLLVGRADPGGTVQHDRELLTFAGSFGAIITLGLLFYEERGIQYCIRLTTVGMALESEIGVRGRFTHWPHSVGRLINEPVASGLIYSSVFASWIFVAITSTSNLAAGMIAAAVGLICLFATRGFYWWITWGEEIERGGHPTRDVWWYRRYEKLVTRRIINYWPCYDPASQDAGRVPKAIKRLKDRLRVLTWRELGTADDAYAKWLCVKFGKRKLPGVTFDVLARNLPVKDGKDGGEPDMLASAWQAPKICNTCKPMIRRNLLGIALALVQVREKACSMKERTRELELRLKGDLQDTMLEDLKLESFNFKNWNLLGCDGHGALIRYCSFERAEFDDGLTAATIIESPGLTGRT